ncbi:MAG: hypothetical protein LBH06_03095 [Rikenellaceae bacterium]|jgi:alpha-glucosidase|nr:hypothetical protein [Rikenellaceae bacterium]
MKISLIILAAAVAMAGPLGAAEMKVGSQNGERWWGAYVGNSPDQPFVQPFDLAPVQKSASGFASTLLLSDMGRYIYCSAPMGVRFDGDVFTLRYDNDPPELFNAGRTLREAYRVACFRYFQPNNIAPAAEFLTSPLYDTNVEFGSFPTQEAILNFAERLVKEGFPKGIILVGEGWSHVPGTYMFDPGAFPDPKAMVDRLHGMGFKLMLTVSPYAAAAGRSYIDNLRKDLLMLDAKGKPMVVSQEDGHFTAYDPGEKRTSDFIKENLLRLKSSCGVDGFRFDCNTLLPTLGDAQGARLMSRWLDVGKDVGLTEYYPGQNARYTPYCNIVGAPRTVKGNPLLYDLTNITSAQLCGYQFCRFVPGAVGDTTALFSQNWLMMRVLQFQSMLPLQSVPFAPWRIRDRGMYQSLRQYMKQREQLAAYYAQLYREWLIAGEPIVRHMEYMFPRSGFSNCNDQFMLGSRYLCAPLLERKSTRMVRLPRGVWVDTRGRQYRGPVVVIVSDADGRPPIFELTTAK